MKRINVMHVLPELEEGGVERMVLLTAAEQAQRGMDVTVISAGGKLVECLPDGVEHIVMPVHRKNPAVGMACAAKIAQLARGRGVNVLHAHSRVPGWICCFARKFYPRVKFVYTAHARLSKNFGIRPLRRADAVISVSRNVRDWLGEFLPDSAPTPVIYNALPGEIVPWRGSGDPHRKHLLLAGRLSWKKDPITVLEALGALGVHDKLGNPAITGRGGWVLDILGDGPLMGEIESRIGALGLTGRVTLHGYSDDVSRAMASCDLFLFPSREDALSLVLTEALLSGVPVIASDISASRELAALENGPRIPGMLPPGDVEAWAEAIRGFLAGDLRPELKCRIKIPSIEEMILQIQDVYVKLLTDKLGNFTD